MTYLEQLEEKLTKFKDLRYKAVKEGKYLKAAIILKKERKVLKAIYKLNNGI